METITNTIIYLILGFIGGYACRVLFDRRRDDTALQGIRSARDINSQLDNTTGQLQERTDSAKASASRAKDRAGEMEEGAQRVTDRVNQLDESVERNSEHIEQAKESTKTARSRVEKIREILAKAEKRKKS
ncbi:MAG: hypothetical protein J6Y02_08150 [Pseudobutyrivibrio sp.]|nr:hypothetical protein [Pseudobutyrivibrio sp.]